MTKGKKASKRWLAVGCILSLILFIGQGMTAAAQPLIPYAGQTEAGSYTLSSAVQWQALAAAVNGGQTYAGSRFVLLKDVDFSQPAEWDLDGDGDIDKIEECYINDNWTPIGTDEHPFSGIIVGGGRRLSGIVVRQDVPNAGLFGVMQEATVTGVKLSGTVSGTTGVGGLCGQLRGGSLSVCIGKMTVNGETAVGGLVGLARGAVVCNGCAETGEVQGTQGVGGLIGQWDSADGGVLTLRNSLMRGTVTADETQAGGLVGQWRGSHLTAEAVNNAVYGDVFAETEVGGLIGAVDGADTEGVTAENNLFAGEVRGSVAMGEIIGRQDAGTVGLCYYEADEAKPVCGVTSGEVWECGRFVSEANSAVWLDDGAKGMYVTSGETPRLAALSDYAKESGLYAGWVCLCYDSNGATSPSIEGYPVPGAFEIEVSAFPALRRSGYSLNREAWNTRADGSGTALTPGTWVTLTKAQRVYAVWSEGVALYGDATGDGQVDMKDVLLIRQGIVHLTEDIDTAAADMNRDEQVDMKDVLAVRKELVGITPPTSTEA